MGLTVLVIDETLGETALVVELLEELEQVSRAVVIRDQAELSSFEIVPDVVVLGANRLGLAKEFRRRLPRCSIIGRGPWQGSVEGEFFPWGDRLREPTLPITSLIPQARSVKEA